VGFHTSEGLATWHISLAAKENGHTLQKTFTQRRTPMLTVKTIKTLSRSLLLASSALAVPGMAFAGHSFTNDNPGDPNFNQLLGINDNQIIAGYFGDGAPS
jgi:hypothetical protein